MWTFIARRLLIAFPTIVLVSVFVFILQRSLPGDPVLMLAGEDRSPEVIEEIRQRYHFNDPLPVQYLAWGWQALHGNLGVSLRTNLPVTQLIAQKLPVTLELALLAMTFALVIGVPSGILAAVKKGTPWDTAATALALWGLSIPNFFLGILLIFFVSVYLQWLPASGYVPLSESVQQNLRTMIMPAFVLGNALAATLMRHTRSAMLSVLSQDYIRTARAKGLLEPRVILKHALRNALVPIVTVATLLFGELLAGAVLTEQIFTIPGFGKLIVDAVFNRDYAVVQSVVLCTALAYIALNLLADVLTIVLNPRLRTAA